MTCEEFVKRAQAVAQAAEVAVLEVRYEPTTAGTVAEFRAEQARRTDVIAEIIAGASRAIVALGEQVTP